MGIGIFAVWPLARRFGKRNVTLAGFILYAAGGMICWMHPTNMTIMLIGQLIKNIGGLPCSYVFMALFADVLDHMEWKTGFRSDGLAMSVYNIIAIAMAGVCTGLFNGLLARNGYVAPELVNGVTVAAIQNEAVKNVITFGYVGLEVITAVILVVLLSFLNVEKDIDKKQEEILKCLNTWGVNYSVEESLLQRKSYERSLEEKIRMREERKRLYEDRKKRKR